MHTNDEDWTVESILAAKRLTIQERAWAAVEQAKQDKINEASGVRQEAMDETPELLMKVFEMDEHEARSIRFETPTDGSLDRVVFFNLDGLRFRVDFSNYAEREIRVCLMTNNTASSALTSLEALGKLVKKP